ncbi:MAG TPA: PhoPQ-activated protein PqaA family protein [Phycisphaerae bacterium]|nr:PhoPQ-activated protein PqaA family protein [Phycisphaerae bacterium]HRY70379.1 PhoPQ-activated protein PqaA family protein [Phycisphaerae bacterium]HSA28096.1 PhoPQ-activated protein PqaA family protein [Phycisphaerae bacterium]
MTRTNTWWLLAMLLCSPLHAGLVDYVTRADESYTWSKLEDGVFGEHAKYAQLLMTSQTWRGIAWKHEMVVIRPDNAAKATQALLIIAGGSWKEGQEPRKFDRNSKELRIGLAIAAGARMPVAVVRQVPFQPLFDNLREDALISYTFKEYLASGEADWPLLLPMTKSAVRAMDTVQAFAEKEWQMGIKEFIVTGASKRGWTTWLTGASDKRVKAIAPMVIDTLNMAEQMKLQRASFGGYSEQIRDYSEKGLTDMFDTEAGRKLLAIVDPYAYRRQLGMPKLILLGTNDRYWPLDALNLYYPALEGEKYILYIPNSGHGLNDFVRLIADMSAFALKASGRMKFPKLEWDLKESDSGLRITLRSDVKPSRVSAWKARAETRDFRQSVWTDETVEAAGDEYVYELPRPQAGFAAAFGEVFYEIDGRSLYLSTTLRIIGKDKP